MDHLAFFNKDFKGLVKKHIPHKYSSEHSMKSEVVSILQITCTGFCKIIFLFFYFSTAEELQQIVMILRILVFMSITTLHIGVGEGEELD